MALDPIDKPHSIFKTVRLLHKINMQLNKHDYWGDSIPGRPPELHYVKQFPPPVPERREAKICARTFQPAVYHPSLPTRDEVRKENYVRRKAQMTKQGFKSANNEPYKSVGHPVLLDSHILITNALGLSPAVNTSDVDASARTADEEASQPQPTTQSKYIPRRARKDLSTLKKEIGKGRTLMQEVKLGSGLFALLKQRWEYKVTEKERELRKEQEEAERTWQRPPSDSESSSGDDDEIYGDIDISRYLTDNVQPNGDVDGAYVAPASAADAQLNVSFKIRSESQQEGTTSEKQGSEHPAPSERAKSAPANNNKRRRRQAPPRPYTPSYHNIRNKTVPTVMQGESLFNQMCALHWLLEAMDIPETSVMSPLLSCWSLSAIGGYEMNRKMHDEEKSIHEAKYNEVIRLGKTKDTPLKRASKVEKKAIHWMLRRSRADSTGGISAAASSSPRGSISGLDNTDGNGRSDEAGQSLQRMPEDDVFVAESLAQDQKTDGPITHGATSDSKRSTSGSSPAVRTSSDNQRPLNGTADTGRPLSAQFRPTRQELRQIELARQLEEVARYDNTPMERLSSRLFRFSSSSQTKVPKEVVAFKASCLSYKRESMVSEGRQQWLDVKDEEALKLHDQLEHLEKHRLKNCKSKFLAMTTSSSGLHRALGTMRLRSEMWRQEERKMQNSQKDKRSLYAEWYLDLCNNAAPEQKKLWYYHDILEKLKKFGMKYHPEEKTESSSKASEIKFLAVLRSLRTWEICSPDVNAAIEYCRENVIEMATEYYEEFLKHEFPSIHRSSVMSVVQHRDSSASTSNGQKHTVPETSNMY